MPWQRTWRTSCRQWWGGQPSPCRSRGVQQRPRSSRATKSCEELKSAAGQRALSPASHNVCSFVGLPQPKPSGILAHGSALELHAEGQIRTVQALPAYCQGALWAVSQICYLFLFAAALPRHSPSSCLLSTHVDYGLRQCAILVPNNPGGV